MSNTTIESLPPQVQQQYTMRMLSVPTPRMIHTIAAEKKTMDANNGTIINFRRYNPLKTSKVKLDTDGSTPPPQQLSATDIKAEISFYGSHIRLNERVTLQVQDPVLNEAARRLAVSMRQTEDELVRDELVASASVIDCTAGTNGDSPTDITESDIDTVTETLLSNDAYSISDMIEGEDKFGTGPVADSFFGMANSDLSSDFRGIAGFLHKSQYPSQGEVLRSEWGNVGNVRILISSIGAKSANTSSNGNDVYTIPICGMEAYACVDIESYGSQFVYRAPIYNDPLAQNATVAWKMATVPVIQNDAWVINLRCTKR